MLQVNLKCILDIPSHNKYQFISGIACYNEEMNT